MPSKYRSTAHYELKQMTAEERQSLRKQVFDKYNGICQNCGIKTDLSDFIRLGQSNVNGKVSYHNKLGGNYPTIEHIIPACDGGTNDLENLSLLCNDCNHNLGALMHYYNEVRKEKETMEELKTFITNRITQVRQQYIDAVERDNRPMQATAYTQFKELRAIAELIGMQVQTRESFLNSRR